MEKVLVLVVEDEPLLRLHAVSLIEEFGFQTLQAGTADEAILFLETDARIRAVFTDIDMPGSMDGLRLARAVRDRWPPVELILTSGHVTVAPTELPERGCFLAKPYSQEQLRRAFDAVQL